MKLQRLQVKNFRCIEDSTEFTICPVTCLVGKNGAGKTSLLEALYKLNPDVRELAAFDVLMEYPRARRRQYQRQSGAEPDDALIATWELEDADVARLEEVLGAGAVQSKAVGIRKGYYPERHWTGAITPTIDTQDGQMGETGPAEPLSSAPSDAQPQEANDAFYEQHVAKLLPKLLYFSEWHMMQGRIAIDALLHRKQKGELSGPDRVFLALLELGGTSVEAISRIERSEELIADLEDAARPVTDEIGRFWTQERDLRVSFHLYPGRPQDPSPFDRGLIFETRIVNTRTNLSLNFEERSTGFVWFFSFLVWYADVRKRYGDNLLILLDDPGLGLHAKAQWDLMRYVNERLAPHYQILYTTHSPFMIDPDRMAWVRTVEDITDQTPHGEPKPLGTKVGDKVLSTNHDTLLPLQASLGYRIMQDMAGGKRLLLVEKPADVIYLNWFSARLKQSGRRGLDPAWTLVPCGDLVRLATLVGLLANDARDFAVLLSLSEQDPDVVNQRELSRMLEACRTFPLRRYARPVASTIEDLIGAPAYPALIDLCYRLPRKQRLAGTQLNADETPILKTIALRMDQLRSTTRSFDPMFPAEYLLGIGNRKARKLPGIQEALSRFENLFADLDAPVRPRRQDQSATPGEGTPARQLAGSLPWAIESIRRSDAPRPSASAGQGSIPPAKSSG
ncbi:MAG: AAA family ATPase [Phycisphaerae bacterium]|nr:AAA family ATPase [Phycisphaerae bacterium]